MQDPLKAHFDMFARYNAWANARVYDAARALSDADYRADPLLDGLRHVEQ